MMGPRGFGQRVTGLMLAASLVAGCTISEAAPTHTITLTLTKKPTPTKTLTPAPDGAAKNGPSSTGTPTPDPCTGWWCTVTGIVYADTAEAGNELEGASVTLHQFSYCSPTSGQYRSSTGPDGAFEFGDVFFHDTDRIRIEIESARYSAALWDSKDLYCLFCNCFASPIEIVLGTDPGP